MSPKNCSLAIDELVENDIEFENTNYVEPKLDLVNSHKKQKNADSSTTLTSTDVIVVTGRITVSF